jgi:hypothetical protein
VHQCRDEPFAGNFKRVAKGHSRSRQSKEMR